MWYTSILPNAPIMHLHRQLLFPIFSPRIPHDANQPPNEQQQCIPRALLLLVGHIWEVCANRRTIPVPLQDTIQLNMCRYYNIELKSLMSQSWYL